MSRIDFVDRLKVAGKELVKLNLGNVAKSFGLPDNALLQQPFFVGANSYRGLTNTSGWSFGQGGRPDFYFDFGQTNSSLTAYENCPPVSAILQQKALSFINGVTWVMGKDGKEAKGKQADTIRSLLKRPNPLQSGDLFEMQIAINTVVYGYTVILPIKPVGFDGTFATQLWALPGNLVEVEVNNVAPWTGKPFKRITFSYGNERTDLLVDEVLVIKDITPSFATMSLPTGRIGLLKQPINNIIGALESRGVLIVNRGPKFVISNTAKDSVGTVAWSPEEKQDTLDAFKQGYGLMSSQSQAIISPASLSVNTVGYDVKELGLIEEVQESSSMVCIGLGFPKFLAGLSDPTFNNQETAEKALYQRFTIPEANNIYGQLNVFFNCDAYGIQLIKDYSKLDVLQSNKKEEASARLTLGQALDREFKNNWITYNRVLELMGEDTIPGMDKYYRDLIGEGYVFGNTQNANNGTTTDTGGQTTN